MQLVAVEGLRATLHPASGRRGILIVGSPGFEDLCAYRCLEALGSECARLGIPALRVDPRGTGESAPALADVDLVRTWSRDLAAAAAWMQDEFGCSEFAIVGLRLGALLASEALSAPIFAGCRLVLLAPPASGKTYLRELKMMARVVATVPTAPALDGLDLAGFHLSQALADGIAALDWSRLAVERARDLLVCGTLPPHLGAALDWAGHRVMHAPFDGYDRLMCDPTASVVPGALVRQVAAWLGESAPPGPRRRPKAFSTAIEHDCWREEGIAFGPEARTGGILCQPRHLQGGPVVLFTNPGGIRRTGWGNMWVDMARDLARAGIASLRFDFSNLTPDLDSSDPGFHYGERIWSEVTAAVDAAEARGFGPAIAVGACSGAFHCLRAASSDPRIAGLVLINQLCYDWSPAHALPLAAWMLQKASDVDRKRRAVDETTSEWARLGAQMMVRSVKLAKQSAKSALRQLRAVSNLMMPAGGQEHGTSAPRLFRDLSSRSCCVEILQSLGDPSVLEYDRAVGLDPEAVPGLNRTILPDADHLLTPLAARRAVLERIEALASGISHMPAAAASDAQARRIAR